MLLRRSDHSSFYLLFTRSISQQCKLHSDNSRPSNIISTAWIVSSNSISNDNGEVHWCNSSPSVQNQSYKETNVDVCLRTWAWSCFSNCLLFPQSHSNRNLHKGMDRCTLSSDCICLHKNISCDTKTHSFGKKTGL